MTQDRDLEMALILARERRPYFGRALAALRVSVVDAPLDRPEVTADWGLWVTAEHAANPVALGVEIAERSVEFLLRDFAARRVTRAGGECEICGHGGVDDLLRHWPQTVTHDCAGLPPALLGEEYDARLPDNPQAVAPGDGGAGAVDLEAAEALRQATAADVQQHARTAGSVPAGVQVWADAVARVVPTPWYTQFAARLRASVSGCHAASPTWARPSRRSSAALRPGSRARGPRIGLVVDTSGSMAGLGVEALSVVRAITRRAGEVTTLACDAAPRAVVDGRFLGGGGTNLAPAIRELADHDAVVVVTDGWVPEWPALGIATLAVILDDGAPRPPAHIHTVYVGGSL